MPEKPRLGFFKFSCCTGCEYSVIYVQRHVAEMLAGFDFVFCRLLKSNGLPQGPFDIALIEGTVTEAWQADELRAVRERSRHVYAIGSCAVCGGIPAIKAMHKEHDVQKRVYNDREHIHSIRPHAIHSYVHVDGYIRGCPPSEAVMAEAFSSMLIGKKPDLPEYSVCIECKMKGNICLLVAHGMPCMGPVTNAGCGALCPSHGRYCYSCWGPMAQANAPALADAFRLLGVPPEDIKRRFSLFGADTPEFRRVIEYYED